MSIDQYNDPTIPPAPSVQWRTVVGAGIVAALTIGGLFVLLGRGGEDPAAASTTVPAQDLQPTDVAQLSVSPTELTLEAAHGAASTGTIEITNRGTATASLWFDEPLSPPWSVSHTCGLSLDAGNTCRVVIRFEPARPGANTDFLGIDDGSEVIQVLLSGDGGPAPPSDLRATPNFIEATARVGAQFETVVTLTNAGQSPATFVIAPPPAPWSSASDCPTTLGPGGSCTLTLIYEPDTRGRTDVVLNIEEETRTVAIPLSGVATAPAIRLTLDTVYVEVELGEVATHILTLLNEGDASANLVYETPAGAWRADTGGCGATLAAGASCEIVVRFEPASAGADQTATLVITDDLGTSIVADLVGTAVELFPNLVISSFAPSSVEAAGGAIITTATVDIANIGTTASTPTRLYLTATDADGAPARIPIGGDGGPIGASVPAVGAGETVTITLLYRIDVALAGEDGVVPVLFEVDRCLVSTDVPCTDNVESVEDDNGYASALTIETTTYNPFGPQ